MRYALLAAAAVALCVTPLQYRGAAPALIAAEAASVQHVEPRADRVVGSSRSDVYHRPSCRHARRIRASNLVEWRSASEARAAGYRACRVCRPG